MDQESGFFLDQESINALVTVLSEYAVDLGTKVLGAVLLWIIGKWLIRFSKRLVGRSMAAQSVDSTVARYVDSAVGVLLNIVLLLAVLSVFGVETTTFAGLLAAGGVAIGMAWSGLLANFAAGVFMVVLRPFQVGDFIEAGGEVGTVKEIGLFVTKIDTMDNVRVIVGNNAAFSGVIRNYTENDSRRVELVAQLNHAVDPREAIELLRSKVTQIPNVVSHPAPEINIVEFNLAGPVLSVRPYTHNDHYWQVFFDTNMAIREEFGAAGFPTPENHFAIRQMNAAK